MTAAEYRMSKKSLVYNLVGLAVVTLITFGVGIIITLPAAIVLLINYFKNILEVTDKGVTMSRGWLNTNQIDIPYSKINSVSVSQNLWAQMLGYGNLVILTGNDIKGEIFKGIDNPKEVRAQIIKHLDK